ncbi:MAG TPA: T9SS type A sorting domain-containing protein [Saprospiraceae bacterium]|nr:T9SS type A sorting domain-containing protein [Saprospiraceae bacterium]
MKIICFTCLIIYSLPGFCKTWFVTNSGNSFSPATITISPGDSVQFNLAVAHNVREVSQGTWNANGTSSLAGGFQLPFGGGLVLPAQLGAGTHYYVCVPHASQGMKGTIVVQGCSPPSTPGLITGNNTVCSGSPNTYSVGPVNGATSYTWSLPGGWSGTSVTNTINTFAGPNNGNITVTANNACGPSQARILTVTVNQSPSTPGLISGNTSICSGSNNIFSVNTVSGANSYTWVLPGGWTGSSMTNTISTTAGTGGGTITVMANNACGSSSVRSLAITVNSPPATPGTINGNTTICSGSTNTYNIGTISGATSYAWVLPDGWTGNSMTSSITVTAGTSGGNISVTANNACGLSQARNLVVTVTPSPGMPGSISGDTAVCQGNAKTYTIAAVTGADSYNWTLPAGWSGSSSSTSINVMPGPTGGNITVSANAACGASAIRILAVAVRSTPAVPGPINGDTSVCPGSSLTYSIQPVNGATAYEWSIPFGWSGNSIGTSISLITGNTSGILTVAAMNACGSSSFRPLLVRANSIPSLPGPITGDTNVCSGSIHAYQITPANGATDYTWIVPAGWQGQSHSSIINLVAGTSSGHLMVFASNLCGSSETKMLPVNALSLDTAVLQTNGLLMARDTTAAYQWVSCPGLVPLEGQSSVSFMPEDHGLYAVILSKNGCVDTSSCLGRLTVSNRDVPENKKIKIWPVPGRGIFQIQTDGALLSGRTSIEITNLQGKTVFKGPLTQSIDLSTQPDGIYFIRVFYGNQVRVNKIIKE